MSFTSTIIGTAERVPLPDAASFARRSGPAVRRERRLRHGATGDAESEARHSREDMAARAIAEDDRRCKRATLRGPRRVLRRWCWVRTANIRRVSTRSRPQTTLAGSRGRGAAADHRPCRSEPTAKTILELGCGWGSLSLCVWRAHFPNAHDHGGFELAVAAGPYRGRGGDRVALTNLRVHHAGHERLHAGRASSIASFRSRCSST